jgi:N-acetylglucosamine-6-phosphate deacetylase
VLRYDLHMQQLRILLIPFDSPGLIDIQINGAYGFDFSVYEGDDDAYRAGLATVAQRIVETGVTSLVPTLIVSRFPDCYGIRT